MEINLPSDGGQKLPPIKLSPWLIPAVIVFLAFSAVGTVFYQVGADEVGIVQRFGKFVRMTQPGLRLKLPFGLETVRNIQTTHVRKEEFGFRTVNAGIRTTYVGRDNLTKSSSSRAGYLGGNADPFLAESLMLTGDLNVAIVEWIVQFTVKDPVAFLFNIREPHETIRNMSEAMMRLVIGDHTINQVLTEGREEIQLEVQTKLQEILDSYSAGVDIRNVILQDVNPPDEVKASFNAVNEARQEKEKVINQAWEEYNRIIPRAKGRAEQTIREAEGYALERINNATGDAKRFDLTWQAYKGAPVVTKQRLYLEMIEKVFPGVRDKIIIDDSQKGILPLLQLNQEAGGQKL